jgi:hypothetical protein
MMRQGDCRLKPTARTATDQDYCAAASDEANPPVALKTAPLVGSRLRANVAVAVRDSPLIKRVVPVTRANSEKNERLNDELMFFINS